MHSGAVFASSRLAVLSLVMILVCTLGIPAATAEDHDASDELSRMAAETIEAILLESGAGVPLEFDAAFLAGIGLDASWSAEHRPVQAVFESALGDGSAGPPVVTVEGVAAAVLAALAMADHVSPEDPASAAVYLAIAKAHADFALVNMSDEGGFFDVRWLGDEIEAAENSEASVLVTMLEALAVAASTMSQSGRYPDPTVEGWFDAKVQSLAQVLVEVEPVTPVEHARAIRAWRAAADIVPELASRQIALLENAASGLVSLTTLEAAALAVAGLDEAHYLEVSQLDLRGMAVEELAILARGLNVLDPAHSMVGSQLDSVASTLVSRPGGLSVFADPSTDAIDVAATLESARLLLGLSGPEESAPVTAGREESRVTIIATEFAFAPDTIDVEAGSSVTIVLDNQGVIPHNIEVDRLDLFVEAEGTSSAEVTISVPAEEGTYQFICSIPGHADGGMIGALRIVTSAGPPAAAELPTPIEAEDRTLLPPTVEERDLRFASIVLSAGFVLAMLVFVGGLFGFTSQVEAQRVGPRGSPGT